MKRYTATAENGEQLQVVQFEDGLWACPVCGAGVSAPLWPVDGVVIKEPWFYGDMCFECSSEYGPDLGSWSKATPQGCIAESLAIQRIMYLNNVKWDDEAVKRIEEVFCTTKEQLRNFAFRLPGR